MSTTIAQNIELPLGYTIVDRLGAGGYGEVWKATAPGGVEKAIKVVFGHCDDGMAERELKSLERIKSVRHPFVLSIERFEIVNNRLVIVTELADMSLSDSFQYHVSEGLPGIPREQLISYLWDAAEALDCLVEQHSLQHLDIKPENLLVVGDHIKVADFGLVKELASNTLHSMMGGMTPVYSAPEIFDDNPSSCSDQYSLAIVYQQMLTGSLPFPGRTPAQLAKQHTLAVPNLNPLSELDRQVVGKALEKNASERFCSCREFVTALRSIEQTAQPNTKVSINKSSPQKSSLTENDDTKSVAFLDTKHLEEPVSTAVTQVLPESKDAEQQEHLKVVNQSKVELLQFPSVDPRIEDVSAPSFDEYAPCVPTSTLFVGVGGVGIDMLKKIRKRSSSQSFEHGTTLAWLAIDTERETFKAASGCESDDSIPNDDVLHIPLRRPKQYREASQDLLKWVSRRWLYNIPRSLQTRGFRPLGRIALVDHAEQVLTTLSSRIQWLASSVDKDVENPQPIRIVFLSGMSGGTGSGTVIDLAQAVRSLCHDFSQEVIVQSILGSTYHAGGADSLAAANMYSLLTEIWHTQQEGNCGESPLPDPASRYESQQRPFDEIYIQSIPSRSDTAAHNLTLQSIANYLLLETNSSIRPCMKAIRTDEKDLSPKTTLRTFNCINLEQLASTLIHTHQQQLIIAVLEHWLRQDSACVDRDAKLFESQASCLFAHSILKEYPDTPIKTEDTTEDDDDEASIENNHRSSVIKQAATAFAQLLETFEVPNSSDQSQVNDTIVISTSDRIVTKFIETLRDEEFDEHCLGQILSKILFEQVQSSISDSSVITPTQLTAGSLSQIVEGPLNCGYHRRSVLISPLERDNSQLIELLQEARPTISQYQMPISETHLVCEGKNLHPIQFGARLAETYPDIEEAAGRLHSRSDINWLDLRRQ